jgi:hypothetical protein
MFLYAFHACAFLANLACAFFAILAFLHSLTSMVRDVAKVLRHLHPKQGLSTPPKPKAEAELEAKRLARRLQKSDRLDRVTGTTKEERSTRLRYIQTITARR